MINKSDIFWCNLPHYSDSVLTKKRPCVIISNSIANDTSKTVQICPITNTFKRVELPCHIMTRYGMIKVEQIMTVDRESLCEYIGHLNAYDERELNISIMRQVGIL